MDYFRFFFFGSLLLFFLFLVGSCGAAPLESGMEDVENTGLKMLILWGNRHTQHKQSRHINRRPL